MWLIHDMSLYQVVLELRVIFSEHRVCARGREI